MRDDMQIRSQHNEITYIFNLVLMNVRVDKNGIVSSFAHGSHPGELLSPKTYPVQHSNGVVPYHRNASISSLSLSKLSKTALVK